MDAGHRISTGLLKTIIRYCEDIQQYIRIRWGIYTYLISSNAAIASRANVANQTRKQL